MITEPEHGIGKLLRKSLYRSQPHAAVRCWIDRRAMKQCERHLGFSQNADRSSNALKVVHAGAKYHRFTVRSDVRDQRIVIALARADLVGLAAHLLQTHGRSA